MEIITLRDQKDLFDVLVLRANEVEMLANFIDYAIHNDKNEMKGSEVELAKKFVKMSGHFVIERKRELRRKINEQG